MDSREALRALGGSLGGILRGHLAASRYVRAFMDTDGKRPLKGKISTKLTPMLVMETNQALLQFPVFT